MTAPVIAGWIAQIRSLDAAGAGTVRYTVSGTTFSLVSADPASGWTVEVEQGSGIKIDLDFRSGTRRVQVDIEFENGSVRERVRFRDDADGAETRTEDGTVVRDDSSDDNSGPGSSDDDSSGRSDDDSDDSADDH